MPALAPGEPLAWDIHADESCQNAERYIVIGALIGRADRSAYFTREIEEAIAKYGGTSELKWTKLRKHNRRMYKAAIVALSKHMKLGAIRYHALVVDTQLTNHKTYNEGDPELGFTKYTFTLLLKFARLHAKPRFPPHFYVHLDNRNTKYDPDVTRITLNRRDAKDHGRNYETYKLVHYVESVDSRLVQMADLFTGMIAADCNRNHTAAHKFELIDFVRERWHLPALNLPTPIHVGAKGIDIWFLKWPEVERRSQDNAPFPGGR